MREPSTRPPSRTVYRAGRRTSHLALLVLAATAPALWIETGPAVASGVDAAGRDVVIPLVIQGRLRESTITLYNPNKEVITVQGVYVGAEGTPLAASTSAPITCPSRPLAPHASLVVTVSALCSLAPPDIENFGYVELFSSSDKKGVFFASSMVTTTDGASFGVAGQPRGAFDPSLPFRPGAQPGLRVIGLRGTVPSTTEVLACYVASLDEPKGVIFSVLDGGSVILSNVGITLGARRMRKVLPLAGVAAGRFDDLHVNFTSADPALVVAGCAIEDVSSTRTIAYTPAQTADPLDAARLRTSVSESQVRPGPYRVGYQWTNRMALGSIDTKVILSTYLRWDDRVSCSLTAPANRPFDPTPWLELQVKDPTGKVVAGGEGAKRTGVFSTGVRGSYPSGTSQRWSIEISFDEAANRLNQFPSSPGTWAVTCTSAAGMSEPLPVAVVFPFNADDF